MWVCACRVFRQLGGGVRTPTRLLLRLRAVGAGLDRVCTCCLEPGGAGSKRITAAWPPVHSQLIIDGEGRNVQSRGFAMLRRQLENSQQLSNTDTFCCKSLCCDLPY